MSDSATEAPATPSRWRNRTFVVTCAVALVAWLAFVGWVSWHSFPVALAWVERQNELLQELCAVVVLLPWAIVLGLGVGAAVELADRLAGTRHLPAAGRTHGQHAAWQRPDRS